MTEAQSWILDVEVGVLALVSLLRWLITRR
jgi:hypothetical protein